MAAVLAIGTLVAAAPAMAATAPHHSKVFDGRAYLRDHGYLPLRGVATLRAAKAHAAKVMAAKNHTAPSAPSSGAAPIIGASWKGINETGLTPPDANGAVGPTRYVETVNVSMAVYDRTGALKGSGSLKTLTGHANLSDPMVLWDPDTQRFYFNVWDTANANMDWGFSKSSKPNTATSTDWCSYETTFGYLTTNAPDYPKLGQTKDFLLIGVNFYPTFQSQAATSGDVLWTTKPQGQGTITTCPAANKFSSGKFVGLKNQDKTQAFTPVPAIQTDPSSKGYIVASSDIECPPTCGTGTKITVFTVKPGTGGAPKLNKVGKSVKVGSFMSPPDAAQKGSTDVLDTLDGRLTHAVSAMDPAVGKVTVWTSHTVAGGGGSEVRWYELIPGKLKTTVAQSGAITNNNLFIYNGGVSPDRVVDATGAGAHGDNMVAGVTTSSATQFTTVQMVSKIGAGAQSALVKVMAATVPENDFSCNPTCRWGDYSGATPDPAASMGGASGEVWLTNELAGGSAINTWNWEATP
jgi:hypothetical protein